MFRAFNFFRTLSSQQPLAYLNQGDSPSTFWPNWTNLNGLRSGRGFIGNKRFLLVILHITSEKSLGSCIKNCTCIIHSPRALLFYPANVLTRDVEAEAEAGSGKRYRFRFAIHLERQKIECVANFLEIYDKK